MLCFNTTFHYHLFSFFLYPILLPGVLLFQCVYSHYVCVRLCVLVSGVFHYRAPEGRNPPAGFHRAVFSFGVGGGVKNNNQIRGCASRLLRFNCIRVSGPTESRANRGRNACNKGRVMSDEALSGLKESNRGVCLRAPNEDWFAGLRCSINRVYNKRVQ